MKVCSTSPRFIIVTIMDKRLEKSQQGSSAHKGICANKESFRGCFLPEEFLFLGFGHSLQLPNGWSVSLTMFSSRPLITSSAVCWSWVDFHHNSVDLKNISCCVAPEDLHQLFYFRFVFCFWFWNTHLWFILEDYLSEHTDQIFWDMHWSTCEVEIVNVAAFTQLCD